jgi:hypothetical protein
LNKNINYPLHVDKLLNSNIDKRFQNYFFEHENKIIENKRKPYDGWRYSHENYLK